MQAMLSDSELNVWLVNVGRRRPASGPIRFNFTLQCSDAHCFIYFGYGEEGRLLQRSRVNFLAIRGSFEISARPARDDFGDSFFGFIWSLRTRAGDAPTDTPCLHTSVQVMKVKLRNGRGGT